MKRLSIVGTVGLPARYGGFETMVENIIDSFSKSYECTVYCSKFSYTRRPGKYKGVTLKYLPFKANGVQSVIYDIISIIDAVKKSDVILVLGVSGSIVLPFIRVFFPKIRIITNIDGLEWKREKWSVLARKFLKLSELSAVKYSHDLVCDNQKIVDYVEKEYEKKSHLIAYGGDHVLHSVPDISSASKVIGIPLKSYYFFVARIEPENNIHLILRAFSKSKTKMQLVGVGNWKNSEYGLSLKEEFKNSNRIQLIDAIYDQLVLNAWRSNAFGYLHGHSAGGTNPSLVEAMSLGLPVLAYDVGFNRETTGSEAVYFKNEEELIDLLDNEDSEKLMAIGKLMKEKAETDYTWKRIANKYETIMDK